MSERAGHKARFHQLRKRKILRRTRVRELRKALEHNKPAGPASSQRDAAEPYRALSTKSKSSQPGSTRQ